MCLKTKHSFNKQQKEREMKRESTIGETALGLMLSVASILWFTLPPAPKQEDPNTVQSKFLNNLLDLPKDAVIPRPERWIHL